MAKKTLKGYFITFEGHERSGKSTQAKLLKRYLSNKGHKCLFIREPGSTKLGERIRDMLLDVRNKNLSQSAEMLLYMAARCQLVNEIIEPSLKQNKIVICDRFLDSTLAYQGYGLGMDKSLIRTVGKFATKNIKPNLTILLDTGNNNGLLKNIKKKDRIELRSKRYHAKVRQGYLSLARLEPRRIRVVKLKEKITTTQQDIRSIVDKCLLRI